MRKLIDLLRTLLCRINNFDCTNPEDKIYISNQNITCRTATNLRLTGNAMLLIVKSDNE
ncbi:TPA: hypothetical protein ACUIW5_004899 [Klebsiella pneumoniae]|uniref:hypothetical protein n=1 Tax=Klebsiella pneumoniae TaxID=573 RepID=UPI0012FF1146|nr:hypothetical protein [Klebsiella pneumoniae]MDS0536600.1 hypothetical protein [Klebsiella pneumoniae]HEE1235116.1 hypothetical protein [Klebsiella pneumoniae]